jgi:hypothetical protein
MGLQPGPIQVRLASALYGDGPLMRRDGGVEGRIAPITGLGSRRPVPVGLGPVRDIEARATGLAAGPKPAQS